MSESIYYLRQSISLSPLQVPEVQQVERTVEDIIEVKKVYYEEEIVENAIEQAKLGV